jgi:glycosyltransferase involved in cell wall biosynthesis
MPFFSIIIPVYNVAPYLRECLDSVLSQTFTDWEAICVDDGSTDGSGAILDEYAAKDKRFRVFHKKTGGVSSARNLALDNAKGEWVWFVDGDDMIHPSSLSWLWARISKLDEDISTFSITNFNESNNFIEQWDDFSGSEIHVFKEKFTSEIFRRLRRAGCTTLVKSKTISNIRFKDLTSGEDVLFQMEHYFRLPKIAISSTPFYFYRSRTSSATHTAPSYINVSHLLKSEYEMLKLFQSNKEEINLKDLRKISRRNENLVWYTFNYMFFKLNKKDMIKLFPMWCEVQQMQQKILGQTFFKRMLFKFINITRSSSVCRLLVLTRPKIMGGIRYVLIKLRLFRLMEYMLSLLKKDM